MIRLPVDIEDKMKEYRIGIRWDIPQDYIDYHNVTAYIDMCSQNWKILEDHGLVDDGWLDGMKCRQCIIAHKENGEWHIEKVKWHESGAWFKEKNGCWIRFVEVKNSSIGIF